MNKGDAARTKLVRFIENHVKALPPLIPSPGVMINFELTADCRDWRYFIYRATHQAEETGPFERGDKVTEEGVLELPADALVCASAVTVWLERPELRDLFPPNVLSAIGCDPTLPEDALIPFPSKEKLPVVMAARMSLSFPVLLQQLPAYSVDYTRKGGRGPERCWFSDGGICSNLPLHFFDSLLPRRPTFALNLKPPHPDYPVPDAAEAQGDQGDYVHVADSNSDGVNETWNRFDEGGGVPLFGFLAAMVDTMQSWNDRLTAIHPGYRDRIASISHNAAEGGLNLSMPAPMIQNLAQRGRAAGDRLARQFTEARYPKKSPRHTGWANHLWVRYRGLLSLLTGEAAGLSTLGALRALFADPPSYRFGLGEEEAAARVSEQLVALSEHLEREKAALTSKSAPHPVAELKGRPRG